MSLQSIIPALSTDELHKFLVFLSRKNKRQDVKNIQLCKLIYTKTHPDEIQINLYGNLKKEAYHALRSRLYASLIDFLATNNLEEENTDKVQIIKYILVAKTFLQQQQYTIAFKLLAKAEKIALEYQFYTYLNEIYHIKIQFVDVAIGLDLDELIITFKKNQQLYFIEEELNIIYAKLKKVLFKVRYKGETIEFKELLTSMLSEHHIVLNDSLSFKSLYQLLSIASISASITKNYIEIEPFIKEAYQILEKRSDIKKQRYYHIQVLYIIANTLFRNKNTKESLEYLQLMQNEILNDKKKYLKRFHLKHQLLYALNLNYSNKQNEAIDTLAPLLKKKHHDTEAILDINLSLIVFYFQKNDIKSAYKLLQKQYHTDKYYTEKAGKEWVIKKAIIELLLLVELDYVALFENRLSRFKRQHKAYLKQSNLEKVLVFINLVEAYYTNPKQISSKEFYENVENSFLWVAAKQEDIFEMSFYAWLKSKMINKPVYEVTLAFIEQVKN